MTKLPVVYTVTTIDENSKKLLDKDRTPGIFTTFELAEQTVLENEMDISEGGMNRYCVIEKTLLNCLYPTPDPNDKLQVWYEWNEKEEEYIKIPLPPKKYINVCGFGIG